MHNELKFENMDEIVCKRMKDWGRRMKQLEHLNWSKVSEQNMEIIGLESQHNLIVYSFIR